jgi:hypothetical protein
MDSLEEARQVNRELAERINDEARSDPTSPYAGKLVGIANGQVVIVTDDPETLYSRLAEIEPDIRRVFGLDARHDPAKAEHCWPFGARSVRHPSLVRALARWEDEQKANRALAERINEEARNDPSSPYAGKFVGIVNGQVVVVTDDLQSLYYRLKEIEPDHLRVFGIEASRDPSKVEYIWRC